MAPVVALSATLFKRDSRQLDDGKENCAAPDPLADTGNGSIRYAIGYEHQKQQATRAERQEGKASGSQQERNEFEDIEIFDHGRRLFDGKGNISVRDVAVDCQHLPP